MSGRRTELSLSPGAISLNVIQAWRLLGVGLEHALSPEHGENLEVECRCPGDSDRVGACPHIQKS